MRTAAAAVLPAIMAVRLRGPSEGRAVERDVGRDEVCVKGLYDRKWRLGIWRRTVDFSLRAVVIVVKDVLDDGDCEDGDEVVVACEDEEENVVVGVVEVVVTVADVVDDEVVEVDSVVVDLNGVR